MNYQDYITWSLTRVDKFSPHYINYILVLHRYHSLSPTGTHIFVPICLNFRSLFLSLLTPYSRPYITYIFWYSIFHIWYYFPIYLSVSLLFIIPQAILWHMISSKITILAYTIHISYHMITMTHTHTVHTFCTIHIQHHMIWNPYIPYIIHISSLSSISYILSIYHPYSHIYIYI